MHRFLKRVVAKKTIRISAVFLFFAVLYGLSAHADIANTKHNLSAIGPEDRRVKSSITQICVFCHTPHGSKHDTPLWNRNLNDRNNYTPYSSPSLDAVVGQPTGYSKLCLSCHDGTFAISAVLNAPGSGAANTEIIMMGAAEDDSMRYGNTNTPNEQFTGDTRRIGLDLSNDHPVSFKFDDDLVNLDEELVRPYYTDKAEWNRAGIRLYPKDFVGTFPEDYTYVQCTSCHNPHDSTFTKFLRANKYNSSVGSNDQLCGACHDKPGWLGSTHEQSMIKFKAANSDGSQDEVGKRACLACHDTHTEHGAVRLLREGASDPPGPNSTAAIENTCFQCHTTSQESLLEFPYAPDIKSEFDKFDPNFRLNAMPLTTNWFSNYDPNSSNDIHAPVFITPKTVGRESTLFNPLDPLKFSNPGPWNVHVECVDCHNPHQVTRGTNVSGDENGGRLKGIPGIDINGNEVGFHTSNPRDVYVMEVCFRCHGDSFDKVMAFPFNGTTQHKRPFTNTNKRLEFDPNGFDPVYGPPFQANQPNSAFHPVAAPGRNTSLALCEQLKAGGFPSLDCSGQNYKTALQNLTINCTDCHNSEATGIISAGPVTESSLRVTDIPSRKLQGEELVIGPHGSNNPTPVLDFDGGIIENRDRSILRDYYFTGNLKILDPDCVVVPYTGCTGEFVSHDRSDNINPEEIKNRFSLCFNCHDWNTFYDLDNKNTNFYMYLRVQYNDDPPRFITMIENLHAFHVTYRGEACMSCHYNIHSNVQAVNTVYQHPDTGSMARDGDTHLINFAPDKITGYDYPRPTWGLSSDVPGERMMACNLQCHGKRMLWGYPCRHCVDGGPVDQCPPDRISDTCCDCEGCCN